jgi:hypothetical protein
VRETTAKIVAAGSQSVIRNAIHFNGEILHHVVTPPPFLDPFYDATAVLASVSVRVYPEDVQRNRPSQAREQEEEPDEEADYASKSDHDEPGQQR